MSEEEINKENLWVKVKERLYLGKLEDNIIVFGSKDFNAYEDNKKCEVLKDLWELIRSLT